VAVTSAAPDQPLRAFYEDPGVPLSSGPDRARRQARLLAGILRERSGPAVILDVGCGDGAALAVAARAIAARPIAAQAVAARAVGAGPHPGHRLAGIDWSAGAVRRAHDRGLTVVRAGVTAPGLPIADGVADVVIMSELIEHLVDPDRAVEEARRVLRPGGSLLLSTPNLAAWYNRGLLAAGIQPVFSEVSLRAVFGRPGRVVAGHLRLFTRRALTQFLAANGFSCVSVTGAAYHDVPRPLRGLDRLACRWPSVASILLVHARKG
jgi:SAM-dependent methyltransferase